MATTLVSEYLNTSFPDADYVPNIWLLTPRTHRAVVHTSDAAREVKDSILRTQDREIEIPLAEIFA
jgi:hypothetical protein